MVGVSAVKKMKNNQRTASSLSSGKPKLVKNDFIVSPAMESTPVIFQGGLHLLQSIRPGRGGAREDYYLTITDVARDEEIANFGVGFGLACAYVENDIFYVYASKWEPDEEWTDIYLLESGDLNNWTTKLVVPRASDEHLFNSSVCKDGDGYAMVYESSAYVPFTVKFAKSSDLRTWNKLLDMDFSRDKYAACPTLRYMDGYYYLLYLVVGGPGYVTHIARSPDLATWEISPLNPVLTPTPDEGINNSDVDLVEFSGRVYVYYATGDQQTWGDLKYGVFCPTPRKGIFQGLPILCRQG